MTKYTLTEAMDTYRPDMTRHNYLTLSAEVTDTYKQNLDSLVDALTLIQYEACFMAKGSVYWSLKAIKKASKSKRIHRLADLTKAALDNKIEFRETYPKDQGWINQVK